MWTVGAGLTTPPGKLCFDGTAAIRLLQLDRSCVSRSQNPSHGNQLSCNTHGLRSAIRFPCAEETPMSLKRLE